MKLFFLKDHSLYKIFKTLEKLPNGKTVHISIDPEHAFFDNEWRGKQIQELLQQRNIHAFFITKTENSRKFFEKIGLPVIHQEKHKLLKIIHLGYLFFFNIKQFHLQAYTKKNYMFYMIFWFEVAFALIILYFLYSLILPRTIIDIYPANQSENIIYNFRYYPIHNKEFSLETKNLAIPYQTWFIDYKYTLSISVKNIKHIQSPSQWTIKVLNPTEKEYNLLKWTRFVTDDWLVFKSKDWFKLDPHSDKIIEVIASDQDEEGNVIWAKGNISKDTTLYIKNLKESFFLKNIYAVAIQQFSWWSMTSEWIVTQKDIEALSWKLLSAVKQQKQNIINQNFSIPGQIFLHFDDLITLDVLSTSIENKAQEKVPYLKWDIVVRLSFAYINQSDLFAQTELYLKQRPSDKVKLLTIDRSSVVFFSTIKKDHLWAYIIPTKLTIIQGYDFDKDINNILESIKTNVLGINKEKARSLLLWYPEISSVTISVRPPWYTSITKLKSRIKMNIVQQK
jgi:hypothetical protein